MDSALIPKGVKRCPTWQSLLWIGAVSGVVLWGVLAMVLVSPFGPKGQNRDDLQSPEAGRQ